MLDAVECAVWTRDFWSEMEARLPSLKRIDDARAEVWGWRIRLEWEPFGGRGAVAIERIQRYRFAGPDPSESFPVSADENPRLGAVEIARTLQMLELIRSS